MINQADAKKQEQGLSKRERSKIQRLIRSDQIQKARNDAKCYKRKAYKINNFQEPEPRKIAKIQDSTLAGHRGKERTSQLIPQKNQSSPSSSGMARKPLRVLKPFNPSFCVEDGELGLFDYIIGYVSRFQEKTMEAEFEDTGFVDQIQGRQLQILDRKFEQGSMIELAQQLNKAKNCGLFSEDHRALLKRITLTGESK